MLLCVSENNSETVSLALTHVADYYYYATAGGARFWVRSMSLASSICLIPVIVEEVPYYYANCPVHCRSWHCLFWQWVA